MNVTNNPIVQGVVPIAGNLLTGYGCYQQGVAIVATIQEIKNTYQDEQITTDEKKLEITTQSAFLTTQVAEVAFRNNQGLPIINCVSGVAEAVKIGVHAHIHHEDGAQAAIKIKEKLFDHTVTAVTNFAFSPAGMQAACITIPIAIGLNVIKNCPRLFSRIIDRIRRIEGLAEL